MKILGIETSCDETAAAVVEDGKRVLSNVVLSQIDVHKEFGGVVPELASRNHLASIGVVVEKALKEASPGGKADIDGVAVTRGPGLIGSLLVGITFAKGFAFSLGLPLCGINHIEAHLYSVFLGQPEKTPKHPYIGLVVSGGHTSLYKVKGKGVYELLGATRDDAAGEAFDKVAKILDLGYPGGPVIDKLAKDGDPKAIDFPRGMAHARSFDFSFSGLKTAVLYYKKGFGKYAVNKKQLSMPDLVASFQEAVVDVLVKKALNAAREHKLTDIVLGGGVSLNSRLRQKFAEKAADKGMNVFFPDRQLCADNAAMIAGLGYFELCKKDKKEYNFDAEPNLRL